MVGGSGGVLWKKCHGGHYLTVLPACITALGAGSGKPFSRLFLRSPPADPGQPEGVFLLDPACKAPPPKGRLPHGGRSGAAGDSRGQGDLLRDSSRTASAGDSVPAQISGIPGLFIKIPRILRLIRKCLSDSTPHGPDLMPEMRGLNPKSGSRCPGELSARYILVRAIDQEAENGNVQGQSLNGNLRNNVIHNF
jgi:hypothetical protein